MVLCTRLFPFRVRRCVGKLSFFHLYIYLFCLCFCLVFFAEKNPYSQISSFTLQLTWAENANRPFPSSSQPPFSVMLKSEITITKILHLDPL